MLAYNLGVMYERGLCVDQNDSIAMRWYGKAAAQSHKGAQAPPINPAALTKRRALRAKSDASGGRDGGVGEMNLTKESGRVRHERRRSIRARARSQLPNLGTHVRPTHTPRT